MVVMFGGISFNCADDVSLLISGNYCSLVGDLHRIRIGVFHTSIDMR